LLLAGLVVGLLVLAGAVAALGGWLWWHWWAPAPHGAIYQDSSGRFGFFATPLDPGQAHVAASTLEYVAVGFGLALVLGAVMALLGRDRALVTLVVALLAGCLGAYVMREVGLALSPPDPSHLADKAHLGQKALASLSVDGWTPYLAWPAGTLLGFLAVMLLISGDRRRDASYVSTPVAGQEQPIS